MEQSKNFLETTKISKLIKKFSIPCVISMVVAALYNIVDQVYIGWSEAGEYGNAATNIVFPFTVLALGLALLFGDGGCANFSLFLGEKNQKKANNSIGISLIALIIISIIITSIGLIFQDSILSFFGANPDEVLCYEYANDYYKIICIGFPFYIIGQGLNGPIRADSSPKYAMACTLAGAIFNLIFDPIFIFGFKMGVKGAALATVMGQIITFLMSILYLFKSKNFKINKDALKFDPKLFVKICSVGLASLIVQLSIVVIATVNNKLFSTYGYQTIASTGNHYGVVTPLAVVGIVLKVFGIVVSIVIGISLGGQPIIGYNIGCGNIKRVKETISFITKLVLIVGIFAFIVFELFPGFIINLFGKNNTTEYMEFARYCIRIFLGGIILTCYIKSSSIMLQAMGKSIQSTIVALTRDVIAFVPTSILIATLSKNIITMLWAAVIADIIGAIVAFILTRIAIKSITRQYNNQQLTNNL